MSEPASKHIDPYAAIALIRRLVTEYGLTQWKRYVLAFALMGVGALCTALSAYLIRDVVNEAYVQHSFVGVVEAAVLTFIAFVVRGFSNYGHAVMLLRVGNSIIAENQRRLFKGLLQQNIGFFAAHHSWEFFARLPTGAQSAPLSLNLLVPALGRDLLTLVGLLVVMVIQAPAMSLIALLVAPPVAIMVRKLPRRVRTVAFNQWTGGTRGIEALQEALKGMRDAKPVTHVDAKT